MTLDVPSDYEDILHNAVASGAFPSPEAALRHALDLLAAEQPPDEAAKLARWNERNRISTEQSEQGLSTPLDIDEVVGRLKQRIADHESSN